MSTPGILRLLFALLLLSCAALLPRTANAAVSCNASATAINFGTVDPQQPGTTTTNGSISFNCRNDAFLQTVYVTMCLNIGAGSGGTTSPYRRMDDGAGHNLLFQLYRDANHTQIWGSKLTPATPTPMQLKFTIPGAGIFSDGTYSSPSYSVFAQMPGNQGGAVAGIYQNSFAGNGTAISGTYNTSFGGYPEDCGSASAGSFPFTVNATVEQTCTVTASELNFGSTGLLSAAKEGTSNISVNCVSGTQYRIGLDNGQYAVGTVRNMQGPSGQRIGYALYRDSGRTLLWGNTPGTDTVALTGNGNNQNTTVYGRVPAQTTPSPGNYSDTVTVNVTY